MRQVLVEQARRRLADKRGAGTPNLPLDSAGQQPAGVEEARMVELDEALKHLAQSHPRLARVVECRYFAGYNDSETALALGLTERTVQRDWVKAKAILYEALDDFA